MFIKTNHITLDLSEVTAVWRSGEYEVKVVLRGHKDEITWIGAAINEVNR